MRSKRASAECSDFNDLANTSPLLVSWHVRDRAKLSVKVMKFFAEWQSCADDGHWPRVDRARRCDVGDLGEVIYFMLDGSGT